MTRIALFGSFYRGYYLLDALLNGAHHHRFEVLGVATGDVAQTFISRHRRVWQYPHAVWEETMVEDLALREGLPVHKGRLKVPAFYRTMEEDWRPDLCIAATFGQRIDARLFRQPPLGFFNVHPCIEGAWPSPYAGPNPFQALIDDGHDHTAVALHRVDDGFDTGELIAMSPRIAIPPGVGVVDMHKLSAPVTARFVVDQLVRRIISPAGLQAA